MAGISHRKQNEINRFQDHAEDRKQPHGFRRQADEENQNQRHDTADNHLPAHGNVFLL
jgi:hypothetical protein